MPLRPTDSPAAARCAGLGFIDVIVEGIDENTARDLVNPHAFSTRFRQALVEPPPALGLTTPLQKTAWEVIVAHSGRPVTTKELAKAVGLSREHLSRNFAKPGAPNLKRVIDLVRLIAAAGAGKKPRPRHSRYRPDPRLCLVIPPGRHGAKDLRHPAGVARPAQND